MRQRCGRDPFGSDQPDPSPVRFQIIDREHIHKRMSIVPVLGRRGARRVLHCDHGGLLAGYSRELLRHQRRHLSVLSRRGSRRHTRCDQHFRHAFLLVLQSA